MGQPFRKEQGSSLFRRIPRGKGNGETIRIIEKKKAYSKKNKQKIIKIALLGSGESGKSTILKQMRNLTKEGFKTEDRLEMKPFILKNIREGCIYILEDLLENEENETENKQYSAAYEFLQNMPEKNPQFFTEEAATAIQECLLDANFKEAAEKRSLYKIQDTWYSLAENMHRYPEWGGPEWVPSDEDILQSRIRTLEVNEVFFERGKTIYQMTDFSGQRQFRQGYLVNKYLADVDVVLYIQSLSEYNLKMFEAPREPRFLDSLQLWRRVANHANLQNSSFVLFFNKADVFEEKYLQMGIPLPDMNINFRKPPLREEESPGKYDKAQKWYRELYSSQMPDSLKSKLVTEFTTATDVGIMRPIMEQVADLLSRRSSNR